MKKQFFPSAARNFWRTLQRAELVKLSEVDITEDPIRPELSLAWRVSHGRKIYGLRVQNHIEAIICLAFANDIPTSVKELDVMSELANLKDEKNIAIAYTVWSRKRGAGKAIVNKTLAWAKRAGLQRVVTLSPLTPMATHFHISQGAKQIRINKDTQNFEYQL